MRLFQNRFFYFVTGPTNVCNEGGLSAKRVAMLMKKVAQHGGQVSDNMNDAEVWIVNETVLPVYQRYCSADIDHRAEGPGFIQQCIDGKRWYKEGVQPKAAMRGRAPGKRNDFTPAEIELLCQWLAFKIPDKAAGGRLGNAVYKQLEEMSDEFPDGIWGAARTHPWSAWRERYKKNQEVMDARIEEIVEEKGISIHSRTVYKVDRRANKRVRVQEISKGEFSEEESEEEEEEAEGEPEEEEEVRPRKKAKSHAADLESSKPGPSRLTRSTRPSEASPEVDHPGPPMNTQDTLVGPTQPKKKKVSSNRERVLEKEEKEEEEEDEIVSISSEAGAEIDENEMRGGRLSGSSAGTVRATPSNAPHSDARSQSPVDSQQEQSRDTTVSVEAVESMVHDEGDEAYEDKENAELPPPSSPGAFERDESEASDDDRARKVLFA